MKILQSILLLSVLWVFNPLNAQQTCFTGAISIFGSDSDVLCLDGEEPGVIRFQSKPFAMPYGYLVLNEQDIIVHVGTSALIDFTDLPQGLLRVVSFSFLGTITAEVGDNYLEVDLAGVCYQLVSNIITISNELPVGGEVSTDTGETAVTLCLNENTSLNFVTDSGFTPYTYVITDDNNSILGVSDDGVVDFADAEVGVCRVWGLAYIGTLNAPEGEDLLALDLANGCYELSSNYVEVTRLVPDAGELSYDDGSVSFTSCSESEPSGSVSLVSTHSTATDFTYIMVNTADNTIASIFSNTTIDLTEQAEGNYQLYGVAYTGNLTAQVGDTYSEENLSDECHDVSSPISLIKRVQHADDVNLEDGSSEVTVCVGDGVADELTFVSTYAGNDSFVYLITDESNFLIGTSETGIIDFEGAEAGICRVWGLAYSGNLTVTEGENIGSPSLLSDECFDLSDGFVLVDRNGAKAGNISYEDGSTSYFSCTALPPTGSLALQVNNSDGSSTYSFAVVNNEDNTIALLTDDSIDLANLPNGAYTIYGIAYFGDLGFNAGDDFDINASTATCIDITESGLELVRRVQNADNVTLEDGSTEATVCIGDGFPDELTFVSTYTGEDSFIFVITDESNFVIGTSETGVIDFENADPGLCRIWGLAYSGNLNVNIDDNLGGGQDLSDECYDLSDGFSIVNRYHPDGGFISLADGSSDYTECNAAETTVTLEFMAQNMEPSLAYSFIIINTENNQVVGVQDESSLDLSSLGFGTYEVYGISYLGNLTVAVGDEFGTTSLSDVCFDLSDNTIGITNRSVNVDQVQIVGGATSSTICPNDGTPDLIEFESDYTGTDNLVYIITDESNVIQQILGGSSTNFDVDGPQIVQIWAVAFSGNFLLSAGAILDETTVVSDDCYDISDNSVLIDRAGPQGGSVSLANGETSIDVCVGDDIADIVSVSTTGLGANYGYVITDENNLILASSDAADIDFEGAEAGICRIWSVAYVGNLIPIAGADITTTDLVNGCFALSENFITVNRTFIDGGMVSLEDGSTSSFACGGDGEADFFIFAHTTTATDVSYGYIITDDQENVLSIVDGNSVNLDLAAPGECHVWGLSYTGDIIATIGENAAEVSLTDGCFELSSNFITIQREEVIGGDVSLADGTTSINICPEDDMEDILDFINSGSTTASYTYLMTDVNNNFLSNISSGSLDFNSIDAPEEVRVWGLAYSGLLSGSAGDVEDIELSNRCYNLSNNFVSIIREIPNAGSVSTTEGATALYLCTDDGLADEFSFEADGASNTDYAFIITDDSNNILSLLTNTNSNDFEGAPSGTCRVWGVAYTGTLLAQMDDNLDGLSLSDDCFDLSDNYVTVVRGELNAGTVATSSGLTTQYTCPGDDIDDIINMTNQDAGTGTYAYALTSEDNVILEFLADGSSDFNTQAEGTYHIWGMIYTGDLLVEVGDIINETTLSSACFDLADNFVTIINIAPVAGTISVDGQTDISLCIGDGVSDLMNFDVTGASGANYGFLVIESDSFLVGAINEPFVDFENAATGDWQIYGISFTGTLNVLPGANIFTDQLSSGCYELTETPLNVDKTRVDGGEVFTDFASQVVYSCPNGEVDIVTFINSGSSTEATYSYVLTNQNNTVLSVLAGDNIDLNAAAGLNELRIWGVSYTGDLLINIGDDITTAVLSDGCSVLSNSAVDIFIDNPDGGMLSLANGETSTRLCHSNSMPGVFTTSSTSVNVGYAYIMTTETNEVLEVSTTADGFVSFDNQAPGIYRIWGLSYTGVLLLEAGNIVDDVDAVLASSCYELSENFVTIERTESLDAANIATSNGEENLFFCPGDDNPDLVILSNDSDEPQFRYFITDADGNILITDIEGDIIDFDPAPAGVYHIYGIAYTGDLMLDFMDNINVDMLSTDCWALTNNFLTVVNESPSGSSVSTSDGETSIELTINDGIDDEVTFTHAGDFNNQYAYIITDEDNVIIGISESATVNFEGAAPGICRVWGVAYTGNITALQGEDLDDISISDDCYQLSDNFVVIDRISIDGLIQDEDQWLSELSMPQVQVMLSPNPTSDLLMVNVYVPGEGETAGQTLEVFNLSGVRISSTSLSPLAGEQDTSLDVSNLEDGMYLLRWFDGQRVVMTRFIKQ